MEDIFEIQEEIARTIADILKVKLEEGEGAPLIKRYTDNIDAYNLYLKGRFHWNRRNADGYEKALQYFQSAIVEDPGFAPAYSGLSDYYVAVAGWGIAPPTQVWPRARESVL